MGGIVRAATGLLSMVLGGGDDRPRYTAPPPPPAPLPAPTPTPVAPIVEAPATPTPTVAETLNTATINPKPPEYAVAEDVKENKTAVTGPETIKGSGDLTATQASEQQQLNLDKRRRNIKRPTSLLAVQPEDLNNLSGLR